MSEHVLDAFVRIKGETIIPGPIRNELKSIFCGENALKQQYIIRSKDHLPRKVLKVPNMHSEVTDFE